MHWLMLLALSAVVAIMLNFIQPKIAANATAASVAGTGYFGTVAVTTVGIFVALVAATFLMEWLTHRKEIAV